MHKISSSWNRIGRVWNRLRRGRPFLKRKARRSRSISCSEASLSAMTRAWTQSRAQRTSGLSTKPAFSKFEKLQALQDRLRTRLCSLTPPTSQSSQPSPPFLKIMNFTILTQLKTCRFTFQTWSETIGPRLQFCLRQSTESSWASSS